MILAIDIGNTRVKAAVFEDNTLFNVYYFTSNELHNNLVNILNSYSQITDFIVSSVGNSDKDVFLDWEKQFRVHYITTQFSFPFLNLYATPLTLGIDRMVLASGAVFKYPKTNRLIVDVGTCITYDFVDENDHYLGGAISPGIRLRYESLNQYTQNLPLLTLENLVQFEKSHKKVTVLGNSTQQSIHSGVINGVVNEIDGFIRQYQLLYPNFIIILTGGDTDFLANRLKNTIFANSNFLLESLNQLFQYKIKND